MMENIDNTTTVTFICQSLYSGRSYLSKGQITSLLIVNVVIMISNFTANSFIVYALACTRQLKNISLRLILYLSISDCCLALIDQPLFIVMITVYLNDSNCTFETVAQFIFVFTKHMTGYTIVLITYDRYRRMKYLKSYFKLTKTWKIRTAVIGIIFMSLMQGVLHVIGIRSNLFDHIKLGVAIIDAVIICCLFAAYIMTIIIVKKRKKDSASIQVLFNLDQVITKSATRISLAVALFYIPYICFTILRSSLLDQSGVREHEWLNFSTFVAYELIFANSFANAVIFLVLNRKSKKKITRIGISAIGNLTYPLSDRRVKRTTAVARMERRKTDIM